MSEFYDRQDRQEDDFTYLSRRLKALDADIRVPDSVRAEALMQRCEARAHAVRKPLTLLPRVAGLAAALVVVVAGALYLRPMDKGIAQDLQAPEAAPEAAANFDEAMPASSSLSAAAYESGSGATGYEEIRLSVDALLSGVNSAGMMKKAPMFSADADTSEAVDSPVTTDAQLDVIQTGDGYLYRLSASTEVRGTSGGALQILDSATLAVTSTIRFSSDVNPTGMFLIEDKLAVLCSSAMGSEEVPSTLLSIYDVSDPAKPVGERGFEQQGVYTASQLVSDTVYLATTSALSADAASTQMNIEQLVPSTRDTTQSETPLALAAEDIVLPASASTPAYTVISAVSLSDANQIFTKAVLGGDDVYLTENSVYVTSGSDFSATSLHKFGSADDGLALLAQGSVPGKLWGDSALSETSSGGLCAVSALAQESGIETGIFTFDSSLLPVGELTGLAPDADVSPVYSAEKTVYLASPIDGALLAAVDLSSPAAPRALALPDGFDVLTPLENGLLLCAKQQENSTAVFSLVDPRQPERSVSSAAFTLPDQSLEAARFWFFDAQQNLAGILTGGSGTALELHLVKLSGSQLAYLGKLSVEAGTHLTFSGGTMFVSSGAKVSSYSLDPFSQTA